MHSVEEMIHALQHPQIAPFTVTFQIFASYDREKIANYHSILQNFLDECRDSKGIEDYVNSTYLIAPQSRLLDGLERHTQRYVEAKTYLEQKTKELGLENPLFFFDEHALRIDIGYGPKEMFALFENFFGHHGMFDRNFLGCVPFLGPHPYDLFLQNHIKQEYNNTLKAEQDSILTRASREFAKPIPYKRKLTIEHTSAFTEAELIEKCLESNMGLIVGEAHEHKSPKQFLVDNMPLFKSIGVTTLYMEHLLAERHQILLDKYQQSSQEQPMPRELELYLNYLDKECNLSGSASFTAVIQAAKKSGIRVIAIDSEAIYVIGICNTIAALDDTESTKDRFAAMNMAMLEKYRIYKDDQKFITFVGSGHIAKCLDVPGVSELLSCPNIAVYDLKESEVEYIEQDIIYGSSPITPRFDILYHRHQDHHQTKKIPTSEAIAIEEDFKKRKQILQEQFITALNKLNPDTNQCKELHTSLMTKQQDFFKQLTQDLTEDELKATIDGFRESCIADVEAADKILGHGWLYRSVEVLIKAVLGLFAGIGMALASFVGQGFLLSAHRQQFANTFFTFHQTDVSRALDQFKKEIFRCDQNPFY